MNKSETIQYVKDKLKDPSWWDYALLAHMLRDHVNPEDEILRKLAWMLGSGNYNCSKGDVRGLIDLMEGGDNSDV